MLEKSYLSPRTFNVHTSIWSLFKAEKIWWANQAFRIILLQRKKFRCVIIFPSGMR